MKLFNRASFRSPVAGLLLMLALLSPGLFAAEPAKAADKAGGKAADKAASKLDAYRSSNTELNKAEVKAALERLDADLALLAAKIDAITDPVHKDELKLRLKGLKHQRDELNSQFRKARYDALAADIKAEWNKLVN